MEKIIISDAYENNLKHISLNIPLEKFTCVTGCSGCGKSSLVFDTIYAESQREYLEGMTGNICGQKLMNKPKVGKIENLRPALNISQNYYNVNPRSNIGTVTEISYYLRSLFAIVNSTNNIIISESSFSSNNPKVFCPNCLGLGIETVVSERLLIPDKDKSLRDGGILYYKGSPDSKEQKYLEALCEIYGVDIEKKISELTDKEIYSLLYADEKIKYKLSYKEGKRKKQHFVFLQGAIAEITEKITKTSNAMSTTMYSKYMEDVPCHVCGGAKLKKHILDYTVNNLNYYEIESMELTSFKQWIQKFDFDNILDSKREMVSQLINTILVKVESLIKLNVGYLSLNRSIPSLSSGERQRIRIATQLSCSLRGLVYIMDEPCKGLHHRDVKNIIQATVELVNSHNTVIAIEHNKQYIGAADNIIQLGPVGGPEGGYVLEKTDKINYESYLEFKNPKEFTKYINVEEICFRNICNQNVKFPVGGITCITGVSGSGKTTLTNVVASSLLAKNGGYCKRITGAEDIKRVLKVNQAPIGKTSRSTVVSYLGIYDEIRSLFAKTETAKKLKLNASFFSMNVKGGRCECCQGTGLQRLDLKYLPDTYIICPECEGKRFNDKVLSVEYKSMTIQEILEKPISELIEKFKELKKIYSVLNSMIDLGLGYLKLGQMSMNLSGGEAQRIKLARALGVQSKGQNLYILDEPTSGLNSADISKFEKILFALQEKGDTILIVEHNVEFISYVADYIVDFGLLGGNAGGTIVAQGKSQDVFCNKKSSLFGLK